jgi:hypothetical protein
MAADMSIIRSILAAFLGKSDDARTSGPKSPFVPLAAPQPALKRQTKEVINTPEGTRPAVSLPGTGRGYFLEVVGEASYQAALVEHWRACRLERETSVRLTAEPTNTFDPKAVSVQTFKGTTLGYLARSEAARYQQLLLQLEAQGLIGICNAKLVGGTAGKSIGIYLDVEPPTIVASKLGLEYERTRGAPPPDAVTTAASPKSIDDHGQPNPHFNAARRSERDLTELLGIAKGMIADGIVTQDEANYLRTWADGHGEAVTRWPLSLVFARLRQFFIDGHIDEAERAELQELLSSLVGGNLAIHLGHDAASSLPLDVPAPKVTWEREVYVFTGKFAYGTRSQCEAEVVTRGGVCDKTVTRRTTFLVVGTFSSRDWVQTSYGRKIERAVELRAAGVGVRIVGEDHWAGALTAASV